MDAIVINNPSVSKEHAIIEFQSNQVAIIKDLNSKIGTNSTDWISIISKHMNTLVPYFKNGQNISDTFIGAIQNVTNKIQETTAKFFNRVQIGVEKAIKVVNEYLNWSIASPTVTPEQIELEQALIFLRDFAKNSVDKYKN